MLSLLKLLNGFFSGGRRLNESLTLYILCIIVVDQAQVYRKRSNKK